MLRLYQRNAYITQQNDSIGMIETYFSLDDMSETIAPVKDVCGWK
jgi:hypothetical protein